MNEYTNRQGNRFAEVKEMQAKTQRVVLCDGKSASGGIPVFSDGNEMYVYGGDSHTLIASSTGAGKTRRVVFPLVLSDAEAGYNMVIHDPKGEIARGTIPYLKKKGYGIKVINFRNPEKSINYNPLYTGACAYFKGRYDIACEQFGMIGESIYKNEVHSDKDPFWEVSSANLFTAMAMLVSELVKKPEEVSIALINRLFVEGQREMKNSYLLKLYVDMFCPGGVQEAFYAVINASNETRRSIFSVFGSTLQKMSINRNIASMMSGKSVLGEDFEKDKPMALFIVSRDESSLYHPIISCMIDQMYTQLIELADKRGGELTRHTDFILDEFASLNIYDMPMKLSAARSRGIRFHLIIQSMYQLQTNYSEEEAHTIMQNCSNWLMFYSTDPALMEIFSKRAGNHTNSITGKESPLVELSQLQHFNPGQALLFMERCYPFVVNLPDRSVYEKKLKLRTLRETPDMKVAYKGIPDISMYREVKAYYKRLMESDSKEGKEEKVGV